MAKISQAKPEWVGESEIKTVQPGVIGSGLSTVGGQPTLFRASMPAELQKFGSSKRDLQISLWEQADAVQVTGTEVSGLDLTVSEDKALSALQILLDRTGYQGNLPGEQLHTANYQGTIPRLRVPYSDFFDAYGLEPGSRDGHHKGEQDALEALRSLAETKRRVATPGTGTRAQSGALTWWPGRLLSLPSRPWTYTAT